MPNHSTRRRYCDCEKCNPWPWATPAEREALRWQEAMRDANGEGTERETGWTGR